MDTITRGNAAEAAVVNALVHAAVHVFVPFGDGCPYDLLADTGDERIRIQVKCARVRKDCVVFNSCTTDHGRGRANYCGRADAFAIYVPELARVYIVPVEDCGNFQGRLRLAPTRNNQRKGVRYAEDYAIERWAASLSRAAA
jgi:PD-(D/E)XK endonuclease